MSEMECARKKLEQGLQELGVYVSEKQIEQLLQYLNLLKKWNKTYNLTAITDLQEMVSLHLLDSLAITPFVKKQGRYIDVGTGAGLPGIPLAICYPDAHFSLLDSNSKKTRFLTQACHELGLSNTSVIHSRVEEYRPQQLFDFVLSRAYASLKDMLDSAHHLCAEKGQFLAMKGIFPKDELEALPDHYFIKSQRLKLPFLSAERHIICIINQ